jgi:hypothetical protein
MGSMQARGEHATIIASRNLPAHEDNAGDLATQASAAPGPVRTPSSLMGAAVSLAASIAKFAASGFKTVDESLGQEKVSGTVCR